MKNLIASFISAHKQYKHFKKTNKPYRVLRYSFSGIALAYLGILLFPQILFAHQTSYKNLDVYARGELDREKIEKVLKSAESKLVKSPIYNENVRQKIFMTESHGLYRFFVLSNYSFASTIPVIENIRVNKSRIEDDLVLRNTEEPNKRSLSGVIAHEVTHNQISRKFGLAKYINIPRWKDEGYSEYIAGETTLSFDEGVKLWKEGESDSPHLAYFKYHQMVKYLLETEKISVEELFAKNFEEKEIEAKVYKKICLN